MYCRKVLVVGQAPPSGEGILPFERTRLYQWLDKVCITKSIVRESFIFDALLEYFPGKLSTGGDRAPTNKEIAANLPRIAARIASVQPHVVVPVGNVAIRAILDRKDISLQDVIGKVFFGDPFNALNRAVSIIPLPHPSGRSTWIYAENNMNRLEKALLFLAKELRTKS